MASTSRMWQFWQTARATSTSVAISVDHSPSLSGSGEPWPSWLTFVKQPPQGSTPYCPSKTARSAAMLGSSKASTIAIVCGSALSSGSPYALCSAAGESPAFGGLALAGEAVAPCAVGVSVTSRSPRQLAWPGAGGAHTALMLASAFAEAAKDPSAPTVRLAAMRALKIVRMGRRLLSILGISVVGRAGAPLKGTSPHSFERPGP